jgi:hypothetical protein
MRIFLAPIVNFEIIQKSKAKKFSIQVKNFCIFKIIYDTVIFANNSFLKFDPLTVTGMALWVILGQNVKNFGFDFEFSTISMLVMSKY